VSHFANASDFISFGLKSLLVFPALMLSCKIASALSGGLPEASRLQKHDQQCYSDGCGEVCFGYVFHGNHEPLGECTTGILSAAHSAHKARLLVLEMFITSWEVLAQFGRGRSAEVATGSKPCLASP
jgi:hypothetical protein